MLLQTLPMLGNKWCTQGVLIGRFMKGVYYKSPPRPRYRFTWDVSVVLKFLRDLYPLENLTLKLLTLKVTSLIALGSAPRAQALQSMSLDYMHVQKDCIIFSFPFGVKTSRIGHQYSLRIEHFNDEKLCAMHTLLFYLEKIKPLR